jgi:hypothetical protein
MGNAHLDEKIDADKIRNTWGRISFDRLVSNLVNLKYTCIKLGQLELEDGPRKKIHINVDDVKARFKDYDIKYTVKR